MISDVSYRNRKTLKRTKIKSKIKYQKMLPLEFIPTYPKLCSLWDFKLD